MDAQGRGRADEIDPADQWVMNPQTGNYELRLDQSAPHSPASRTGAAGARRSRRSAEPAETATPAAGTATRRRSAAPAPEVPGQRSRRGGDASGRIPQQQTGRRKRKQPTSRKKKVLLWTGGTMAFVLVGASAGAYYLYQRLDGNISSIDVGDAANGGALDEGPLNILVIGNDVRTGEGNESYGDKDNVTGHADTTILFHVSEDRTNATAMSIPRDLKIEIPDCPTRQADGSTKVIPGSTGTTRFNESLGVNGRDPGCTMRTVKEITGVEVDHFMMVDFNAVKTLSTAVGGVEVCLNKPIHDKDYSKLDLPAGKQKIQGEVALAFLRNRHGLANESDLDRIKQQQQFVASMIRQLKKETLGSPTKMLDVADAATKALTVDTGIGKAEKLVALAKELGKIDLKNISFMTVPVVDNPDEPEGQKATVVPDPVKAPQVFSMIQNDVSFTEVEKKEKEKEQAAKDKQAELLKGPRADASDVRVDVLNGGGPGGSAQKTLDWLQNSQGVLKSSKKGNAEAKVAKTQLEYAPNQADQARKLADLMGLPASALKPGTEDAEDLEAMTLTLGPDFKGAGVPIVGPQKPPKVDKVEADKQVCAGS